jgi:hypothetical protein
MRKMLLGVIAAGIIVGTGAYFGTKLWAQLQTKSDIEGIFDSLKGTFATVSRGKIDFDSATRNVKVPDVLLQSADKVTTVKFEQIAMYGTSALSKDRFAADRIEFINGEITTAFPTATGAHISYKMPKIVIENYSGPTAPLRAAEGAPPSDIVVTWLENVAASSATSITIPKLFASLTPQRTGDAGPAVEPFEYTYTDVVIRELRDRHIAEMSIERMTVTSENSAPDLGSFAAAMARFSLLDFNLDAPIAIFKPEKVKDDGYIQAYRQASVGPFEFRFAKGVGMQIDGFLVEGIGIRPSKLSYASIIAMMELVPKPGTPPSPDQLRTMMEQVANYYDGIRFTKLEMRGFKTEMTQNGGVKLEAIRLSGFENGRLAEFAIEGVEGVTPQNEPFRVGRFALKGLRLTDLMRQSMQMAQGGSKPTLDQSLALLALLEGIEISDITGNNPGTKDPIKIERIQLSWGQFVGPIPTMVRLLSKMTVPSKLADAGMGGMLSDAGMPMVSTTVDFGLAWSEPTLTLTMSPAAIELEKGFAFNAKWSLLNVQRSMFSVDVAQAMAAANLAEIGPLEITLKDTGAVTTALTQYAKGKGLSTDDARKEIIDSVTEAAKGQALSNPDAAVVAQAVIQFIETPGSTLTIKVTPKNKLTSTQLFGVMAISPEAAAALFTIEARTTQ